MTLARWGMPSPVFALKGRKSDPGVTNVRNVASPHWRRWLGVENRCLVPFTSFSENEALPDGIHPPVWFALDETRPLAFFAGIWTRWTSVRKVKEGETTNDMFAFLTTRTEQPGRRDPSEGDAGDSDDARGDRHMDDRARRWRRSGCNGRLPTAPSGSSAGARRRTREASRPDVSSRQATRSGAEARRPADPSFEARRQKLPIDSRGISEQI